MLEKLYSEKAKKLYLCFIFCTLYIIIWRSQYCLSSDIMFFYNRIKQLDACLSDGIFPWFYYKDFNNLGYGNSFFYGDILNYIFIPVVKYCHYFTYYLVVKFVILTLWFVGAIYLSKKLVKDYTFLSILILTTPIVSYSIYRCFLIAMLLAQGLSLFFFAVTLQFFRDKKSCIPSSILFWLILNTHNLTALLCFLYCVLLLIKYFRKEDIKRYLKFIGLTIVLCSYFLCNFLYHAQTGCLGRIHFINKYFLTYDDYPNLITGLGGNFAQLLYDMRHLDMENQYSYYAVASIPLLVAIFSVFINGIKDNNIKLVIKIGVCLILLFVSCSLFNETFLKNIFQFPIRYLYCILIYLCYIITIHFKSKYKNLLLLSGLISLILAFNMYSFTMNSLDETDDAMDNFVEEQFQWFSRKSVLNGEYLEDKFEYDKLISYWLKHPNEESESLLYNFNHLLVNNQSVDYTEYKDTISVNIHSDVDSVIVQFPKLYYKGYELRDENNVKYDIYSGYSQLVTAKLFSANHTYTLQYVHPLWLKVLYVLDISVVLILIIYRIRKRKYNQV